VRFTELHEPDIGLVSCRSAGNGVEAPLLAEVDRQREAGPPAAKGSPPKAAADDLVGARTFVAASPSWFSWLLLRMAAHQCDM
jgi:hypothetical protein